MTRFELEVTGALGEFWRKHAEQELDRIAEDLEKGLITIDENGVARNRIGKVLMSDMLEKLTYVTDKVDEEATRAAEAEEARRTLAEYRRKAQPATEEEKEEMRAAFGKGKTVVNILTGERIRL